jgi:hypothetical protein
MIQRIQSLFLLIVVGLTCSLFFSQMYETLNHEVLLYRKDYVSLILTFVPFVLSVVTLVSFKKRIFQIRLCNLNALILLGFQIYLAVKFFTKADGTVFSITAIFPIIAAILSFIAMRYIARDQALVMASSRLRSPKRKK